MCERLAQGVPFGCKEKEIESTHLDKSIVMVIILADMQRHQPMVAVWPPSSGFTAVTLPNMQGEN